MTLIGCAGGGGAADVPLTDFDALKLSWITVNDDVMGGRSEGGFGIEDGILVFTGATNTDGGGFSSIRTVPRPLPLEGRTGVRLRVRGDGRTYRFRLSGDDPRPAWWLEFETEKGEWMEIALPFADFVASQRGRRLDLPPPAPETIRSLGLMIFDRRDGPFRLEVDWIRAYAAFSLASLEWKRRPLVVFAPTGDDEGLREQLRRVEEVRAGFDERDMELVIVAPGHALSAEERQAVRRRLDVAEKGFTVCLVGKDGTVKRRAEAPLAMEELFALIDAMPMRKNEMEK